MLRRSLTKESQRLAERIQIVTSTLGKREARVAELEAMFGSPDLYENPDQVAGLSMEYQELKAEVGGSVEKNGKAFVGRSGGCRWGVGAVNGGVGFICMDVQDGGDVVLIRRV